MDSSVPVVVGFYLILLDLDLFRVQKMTQFETVELAFLGCLVRLLWNMGPAHLAVSGITYSAAISACENSDFIGFSLDFLDLVMFRIQCPCFSCK